MTSAFIAFANVSRSVQITATNVLLAVTPIATGDSGVIFRSMLLNYYTTENLTVNFANIQYEQGFYSYPSDMNHIAKTGGEEKITGGDFKATGVATADLKGQAVFTGWAAVDGGYPVPAGVSIPTIDVEKYQNAVSTTPTTPDGGENNGSNNNGSNNNDSNNGSSNTDTTAPETKAPTTKAPTTEAPAAAEGGCGSTVGMAGLLVLALVAVAAVVPTKKKVRD